MKWYAFDPSKGSHQKRPKVKKFVLVLLKPTDINLPPGTAVGYMKNAAGDKQSPQFIIPGIGGEVLAWCDCLPEGTDPWEWWRESKIIQSITSILDEIY